MPPKLAPAPAPIPTDEPIAPPDPGWRYQNWLPYWAVLRNDMRQTLRGWGYRLWVAVMLLGSFGFLLYRFGLHAEARIDQDASVQTADLLRGMVVGSLAMIVILTVSSISSERGSLADSILSRGISRHQYYLAKWHARCLAIVGTFVLIAAIMMIAGHYLMSENLTMEGGIASLVLLSAILLAIVSWGVTIGALTHSTMVGITILWITLYGVGYLLSFLPSSYPTPRALSNRLPFILQGHYDDKLIMNAIAISFILSIIAATLGLITFARRDV